MATPDQSPERVSPLGLKPGRNVRLPLFFSKIEVIGVIVLAIVAVAVKLFPERFTFAYDTNAFFWLIVLLILSTLLFYEGVMRFANSRLAHYTNNVVWIVLMGGIIAVTGGVKSPFIFLILFPLLTSVFDLIPLAPLSLGALGGATMLIIGFVQQGIGGTPSGLVLVLLEAGAIFLFGYFVSLVIRETLHDRFEKEELKSRYAEFTEIDRVKDSLMTIVGNEFQHPLDNIGSALILARDKILDGESRDIIERGIGTLRRLTQRMQQVAHIQNIERAEFDLKKRNIVPLLSLVVYDLEALARQKNVNLHFDHTEDNVPAIVDEQKFSFALAGLVDNAVRYSPNGNVSVDISSADDVITISIEDTGIGVSEAFRPRLFSRFSRAKDAIRLEPTGLGIGLYVAQHIIHKHDGSISIESVESKGTKVNIVLPKA